MRSNRFWHIDSVVKERLLWPPCPAEWLPTNSLRLARLSKMSTPCYEEISVFHMLPQGRLHVAEFGRDASGKERATSANCDPRCVFRGPPKRATSEFSR